MEALVLLRVPISALVISCFIQAIGIPKEKKQFYKKSIQ